MWHNQDVFARRRSTDPSRSTDFRASSPPPERLKPLPRRTRRFAEPGERAAVISAHFVCPNPALNGEEAYRPALLPRRPAFPSVHDELAAT
jgi:hypothetical protein